jgi:hypothetical protein
VARNDPIADSAGPWYKKRGPTSQVTLALQVLLSQPAEQGLEGILERVVFCNEENAWTVVRLAVPGRRELVTAVGNLLGVQVGESLRLRGQWIGDPKYGEQFRASSYQAIRPSTLKGVERYLGSGLVPGIGKVMAARIVAHFKQDALEIIEHHPERLAEVEGIGPVRSQRIRTAWAEQGAIKEVMIFLQGHGVSPTFAVRIYKLYGQRAITLVQENPYRLAEDVFGIGFPSADRIARSLGIEKDSPRRAEAGVLHTLGELAGEGHVFCPRVELSEKAKKEGVRWSGRTMLQVLRNPLYFGKRRNGPALVEGVHIALVDQATAIAPPGSGSPAGGPAYPAPGSSIPSKKIRSCRAAFFIAGDAVVP